MSFEGASKRVHKTKSQIYAIPLPLKKPNSLASYVAGLLSPWTLSPNAYIDRPAQGKWDYSSNAVIVTEQDDIRLLWERGFFGKGNLSRSEPSWLARHHVTPEGVQVLTPEELTAKRRQERNKKKMLKAKLKEERAGTNNDNDIVNNDKQEEQRQQEENVEQNADRIIPSVKEHLQLDPQETFFLVFALGTLEVYEPNSCKPLTINNLWQLLSRRACIDPITCIDPINPSITPDNKFIMDYIVYHHYRSLGFVPRQGVKFGVDWVIYKGSDGSGKGGGGGPIGGHAEFAVIIIPVKPEQEIVNENEKKEMNDLAYLKSNGHGSWRSLNTINRVVSGVKKTLVLAYVHIPQHLHPSQLESPCCITNYRISEVIIRRFAPTRIRD